MNMLRDQKNSEYREMIKETLAFDPGILQRFVNFMNNPDKETAIEQFGNDDRYFAVCTLLATLPGLPMFGHGQIEGLSEKYGMEYIRAYKEEKPDNELIARHEREIFPLLAHRALFAGADNFRLFDLKTANGSNENVFAFSNTDGSGHSLVLVNNTLEQAVGTIHRSSPVNIGEQKILNENLISALGYSGVPDENWLLMREHIAGLWYLRSMEELRNQGLSVLIDGFGRQVFMEFRVEEETADGIWGKLAAELCGGGTADPDAAAVDIRLRPIRDVLNSIISPDLIADLAGRIRRGRRPLWPRLKEDSGELENKLAELSRLHRELQGESGDSGVTRKEIVSLIRTRLNGSARLWRLFGGSVRRHLRRRYSPAEWDEAVFLATWSIAASLAALVSDRKSGAAPLLEIWDSWGLEKWSESRTLRPLKTALAADSWMNLSGNSGEALSGLMSNPVIRQTCGVNSWDGVLWYNREGWNETVRSVALSAAADFESTAERRRSIRRLKVLLKKWRRAHNSAEFHVDRLLDAAR